MYVYGVWDGGSDEIVFDMVDFWISMEGIGVMRVLIDVVIVIVDLYVWLLY